jgi:hypothetical protein
MHNIGTYSSMPSPATIRRLYAGTKAEDVGADAIESNKAARAVVDDVNTVHYDMRRLDQSDIDGDKEKGRVDLQAQPKSLSFFQRATGIGSTPLEDIAAHASSKGDVASVSGSLSAKEMDVTVSFSSDKEPLIYSKMEAEDGTVFFQRGNETVGLDVNGNLFMQQMPVL